jgi:hypothetical protein
MPAAPQGDQCRVLQIEFPCIYSIKSYKEQQIDNGRYWDMGYPRPDDWETQQRAAGLL